MKKKIKILISASPFCKHSKKPISLLKKNKIEFDFNPKKRKLTESEILDIIGKYDGLIADIEPLNDKVLSNGKNLKIISRVGIGVNNIDLVYAKKKGIVVANTPDAPTEAVAELNLGLILNLIRNISIHNTDIKRGKWERKFGLRLKYLNIGILGLGRVGRSLSQKLLSIGSPVIFYNDLKKKNTGKSLIYKNKNFIFKNCDVICITLPETNKTIGLLNKKIFKIMKKNSFLINTSRGDIINERDLLLMLKKDYFSGVALDVFNREPYDGDLRKFKRCIMTPHVASHTIDCRNRMELEATENLINYFNGDKILFKL